MNMHAPQSEQARIELRELAAVPSQILSPANHKPIISITQDTLVGSYLFTRYDNYLTKDEVLDIMVDCPAFSVNDLPEPEVAAGIAEQDLPAGFPKYKYSNRKDLWSGRQVFSLVIPPVNLKKNNNSWKYGLESSQNKVNIEKGQVISGVFDKEILGQSEQSLIHIIFKEYGQERTQQFLDDIQNIITNWILKSGFSVGIGDLVADRESSKKMADIMTAKKNKVTEIIEHVHKNILETKGGKTVSEEFESQILAALNTATGETGQVALKQLDSNNRMLAMILSGSKADAVNIGQMISGVGQQSIEGKRVQYGFTDRTLPHFHKYDDGAQARGFVENSFIRGLTPTEFFFHAMGGREGLIDTAVKTSETGYIQRKLVKAMEDAVIATDYTVRNSNGTILQFLYGEDGFDGTKIEKQKLTTLSQGNKQILDEHLLAIDKTLETRYIPEIVDDILANKEYIETQFKHHVDHLIADRDYYFHRVFKGMVLDDYVFLPINFTRIIDNAATNFPLIEENQDKIAFSDLHPSYVLTNIEQLAQTIKITDEHKGNELVMVLARIHLSPQLLYKKRIGKVAFDYIIANIIQTFYASVAHPGELVGTISAQSLGEPTTQLTLNSVDWDTEIIISKNGKIVTPMIGEFIDNYYETAEKTRVTYMENEQIYIPLEDGNVWKALSVDKRGNMKWTKLEAITRHPVINKDGTDTILEVKLKSGREIKATKAKSFLVYKNNNIEAVNGDELQIGDLVPVAKSLDISNLEISDTLDISYLFPKDKFIYGCEIRKTLEVMYKAEQDDVRHWFKHNLGKEFIIPYTRSDIFKDAIVNGKNSNANDFKENCLYPLKTRPNTCHIPYNIDLDSEFGFFCGAYVAEGMSNSGHIIISNNDQDFNDRIHKFANSWNITYHIDIQNNKNGENNKSTNTILHTTVLAKIMSTLFGNISYVKKLPEFIYQAPDVFIKGFIDGYMSGDGTVGKESKRIGHIGCSSVSKDLIYGLSMLFARYNIHTSIHITKPSINTINKYKSVQNSYSLTILQQSKQIYANTFSFTIKYKQDRLNIILANLKQTKNNKYQLFKNTFLDPIVSITEIKPMCKWVYDLTVEETRNFSGKNLVQFADTFHQAGVAAKSNVNKGVPRMKEILNVTKNMKTAVDTVQLKEPYCYNKEYAQKILNELSIINIKQLTTSTEIYFDPTGDDAYTSKDAEDNEILDIYKEFSSLDTLPEGSHLSPWVLRLKLNKVKMIDKNIRMSDIYHAIISKFNQDSQDISCIFSDDNSTNLILRIQCITNIIEETDDCDQEDTICILKTLEKTILNDIILTGVKNINGATMTPENYFKVWNQETQDFQTRTKWVVSTEGTNLEDILCHPAVDPYKTVSNDINEIYDVLGLEAARSVLCSEIFSVFETSSAYVNHRHINLLADIMTNRGYLMSVDRHGINKSDNGPLAKCSFEETPDIIARAAIFGQLDKLKSVSSNIMLGQEVPIGTGSVELLFDEEKYIETIASMPTITEEEEQVSISEKDIFASRYCEALF